MKQQTKFKQTEIGEIPEDWKIFPISKLISIPLRNRLTKPSKVCDSGYKIVNTEEKTSEKSSEKGGQISGQMLTKGQERVLELIKQNPRITRDELSDKLQINPSAIQKHIDKLKESGKIKRIGPDKGGSWGVLG